MSTNHAPPGYFTNGDTSADALILEARYVLAQRYGDAGRVRAVFRCFYEHQHSPSIVLRAWDLFNMTCDACARNNRR